MTSTPTTFSLRCSIATVLVLASRLCLSPALAQNPIVPANGDPVAPAEVPAAEPAPSSPTPAPSSSTEDVIEPEAPLGDPNAPAVDTVNYTDEEISVDYPATWQLERLEEGVMISNVTTAPDELIATQIVRIPAPPGAVVNANLESFDKEGSEIARYTRATVNGADALVLWLTDRPDEFGRAIATFIGYEDETVLMFSRYSADNATAEADILRLHGSFKDPASAVADSEDTEVSKPVAAEPVAAEPGEVESADEGKATKPVTRSRTERSRRSRLLAD